ncbi:DUF1735 and LamG domain-containing protein [Sphingobacterium faecale]|uniref:DUF1735 and LamG domain-containing protein n=1 Tax=Sphingobacterium faecale TaxID=2803775 RepID=A0ABS1QXU7_9SPHI|nr:DUF1735 and LamG domain-containing protein [Sphingobacterium faecale]MBL1407241.1 DUF1735 and LamG domain-containing protein [Sphingobacterium faecale]
MKKKHLYSLGFMVILLTLLASCKNEEVFDNKAYISTEKLERIINKPSVSSAQFDIKVAMARPESAPIEINLGIDPSKLNDYAKVYNEKVEILPADFYTLSHTKTQISLGAVESTPITVSFDKINTLDREKIFVLPVSLTGGNLALLESQKTVFYTIKGGALIDVVADIEDNYLHIDQWKNPTPVNNLSQFTLEALVRVRNYDRMISTIMGIEGNFLIRLGDANFPPNQIQVATSAGNMPGADAATKGLPTNQWVHLAVAFNGKDKKIRVYVNGKLQSEGNTALSTVSFGKNGKDGFYIGRSYEDARFLAGDISECRIWNTERTADQIASNPYEVAATAEGLVAYWKCNEGNGSVIKDHTPNGNDLTAKKAVKWTAVTLPTK